MVELLTSRIHARRAIEALRAGVPNHDAVMQLGTAHADIEERFREHLEAAKAAGAEPRSPAGFLIAGNFGTGKSHLLEYLQLVALAERFVVSKVVISKETPLFDPAKLYRAAVRAAVLPGRVGAALPQVAAELAFDGPEYLAFNRWLNNPRELNQRFAATMYIYEHARHDPELRDRMVSFWSGDPIQIGEMRRALRELSQAHAFTFDSISIAALAYERFRFVARMMLAAGYSGWVLLFDEVDLVARYSLFQRAKSYAQVARFTGQLSGESFPGITSVVAITSAYEAEILEGRNDREVVPNRLLASPRESDQLLARQAERGIRLIHTSRMLTLAPPSDAVVDDTYAKLRAIHARAYEWEPPDILWRVERARSTRMREYVRAWINEWDLRRLYPDYQPSIEVTPLNFVYEEDADLQAASEEEQERSG
jgi:hypothetical protein